MYPLLPTLYNLNMKADSIEKQFRFNIHRGR